MKLKSIGMVSLLALTLSVAHDAYAQVREAPQAPAAAGGGGGRGGGRGGQQAAVGEPVLAVTLAPAKADGKLTVTSSAFKAKGKIGDDFSQNGKGVSPPLAWTKGPKETQSYVVIAEDAGGRTVDPTIHWLAYDIPATVTSLPQGVPGEAKMMNGGVQGLNSRRAGGYMGPKPPMGVMHPYHFEVFALDVKLALDPATTDRKAVVAAMKEHVLASGELAAGYTSPQPAFDPKDITGVWMQAGGVNYQQLMDWTPKYAAILKEHLDDIAAGKPYRHDQGACLPRGITGIMTGGAYPLEIYESKDGQEFLVNKEVPFDTYHIRLNAQHRTAEERFPHFFGDNVGHWEGDTLVVDVVDLGKGDTLDAQAPHSPDLHVTQRLHRITYDTLENTLTLEDPQAWTKPVTATVQYKRHDDTLKNAWHLDESICENDRNGVDANGNQYVKQ